MSRRRVAEGKRGNRRGQTVDTANGSGELKKKKGAGKTQADGGVCERYLEGK